MKSMSIVLFLSMTCTAATIHIPGDYPEIQDGVNAALDGDTVLVAAGAYEISRAIDVNALVDSNGDGAVGVKNITLKSTDGPGNTTISMTDEPVDHENASVFIFKHGETSDSVLEGFTITGGQGVRTGEQWQEFAGGGLYVSGASPLIKNCIITGNSATLMGGGVYCADKANPVFTNCIITMNSADYGGAGASFQSAPVFINCLVTGNAAKNPCCTMDSCAPCGMGGAFYFVSSETGRPKIINSSISGNSAGSGGNAIYCKNEPDAYLVIYNCIIWDNQPILPGGGPGAIHVSGKQAPAVAFSCIQGDTVWEGDGNINTDPAFSAPGQWDTGAGPDNWEDFKWMAGDYHLQEDSPAINAGSNADTGTPGRDLDGITRPCEGGIDMGAYEHGDCREQTVVFMRGDSNADGSNNLADAINILDYLFGSGSSLPCPDAADGNDDGKLDLSDAVTILSYLFASADPLPDPFTACGSDPTPDDLSCEEFTACP